MDEIEFGVGIHGEPGRKREKIKEASLISEDMISVILKDFEEKSLNIKDSNGVLLFSEWIFRHTLIRALFNL